MDSFKNQEDTTESWYNGQIDTMLKYYDILDNMFVVEEKNMTTDSSDNKGNEKTDAIASEWLGKTLGE